VSDNVQTKAHCVSLSYPKLALLLWVESKTLDCLVTMLEALRSWLASVMARTYTELVVGKVLSQIMIPR
jgi:hypothetical protein